MPITGTLGAVLVLIGLILLGAVSIRIVRDYERAVVFRLGRVRRAKGPGIIFLIPLVDRMVRVSLRLQTVDVAPQDVITADTVSVQVNGVLMFRVTDPVRAVIAVDDYVGATGLLAQTTLRTVLGSVELDTLLSEREQVNAQLQQAVAEHAALWGVEVLSMEVKHVDLPESMRRAMAREAEADRERQAKIVAAQGELDAAQTLLEAAQALRKNPVSLQLRYLHTLVQVAAEQHSQLVFPLPMELSAVVAASSSAQESSPFGSKPSRQER
ncbi:MAG: membrane protein [Candidatus Poribacteria bacterium]|nr:MAG: membrane protein [Candidatus Poribacteria bacterium]